MMTLPIRNGRGRVAVGREEHPLAAGQWGVIGTPMRPHAFALDTGYEALQVAFSRTDLQATASAITGLDSPPYLEFEPSVQLDSGGGGTLDQLIQFVVSEVDADRGRLESTRIRRTLLRAALCLSAAELRLRASQSLESHGNSRRAAVTGGGRLASPDECPADRIRSHLV